MKSWAELGFNNFLTRHLQSQDENYQTSEEFNLMTGDATIRSAKLGGNIIVKKFIVNDGVRDRVVIGFDGTDYGIKFYDASGNLTGNFVGSTGKLSSADGKTYFDLVNNVFICNDGSDDRILIGKDAGGF